MCHCAQNGGTDVQNFVFKFFGEFFQFCFEIATPPTVFLWFSRNLAHMIYVCYCAKNVQQIFKNFDLNFFWQILKFSHFDSFSGKAAVELSRLTGLPLVTTYITSIFSGVLYNFLLPVWMASGHSRFPYF